jgi:hypothetical protein
MQLAGLALALLYAVLLGFGVISFLVGLALFWFKRFRTGALILMIVVPLMCVGPLAGAMLLVALASPFEDSMPFLMVLGYVVGNLGGALLGLLGGGYAVSMLRAKRASRETDTQGGDEGQPSLGNAVSSDKP